MGWVGLGHTKWTHGQLCCTQQNAVQCYRYSVVCVPVCVSVCLLVTTVSCAETTEPIEMAFGLRARAEPRNRVLGEGSWISPMKSGAIS